MLNEIYVLGNVIAWHHEAKKVVIIADEEEVSVNVSKIRMPKNFDIVVEESNVVAIKGKIINNTFVATKLKVLDSVKVD
jgi:hypothetical protein